MSRVRIEIQGPPVSPISGAVAALRRITAREPAIIEDVRPDLCPELARVILRRRARERSNPGTLNVGGWKSGGCFQWDEPCMRELEDEIESSLGMRIAGWAMVNDGASYHHRHQHTNAELTGIYYITGDLEPQAPTVFEIPGGRQFVAGDLFVAPKPGRLVLFPGDMWHRVDPFERAGADPRITIAFDVRK